jgi:hypothetical protein
MIFFVRITFFRIKRPKKNFEQTLFEGKFINSYVNFTFCRSEENVKIRTITFSKEKLQSIMKANFSFDLSFIEIKLWNFSFERTLFEQTN